MSLYDAVSEVKLRERIAAAGIDLPPELVDVAITVSGELLTALDGLLAIAPADTEPFVPARQLPDDAA